MKKLNGFVNNSLFQAISWYEIIFLNIFQKISNFNK